MERLGSAAVSRDDAAYASVKREVEYLLGVVGALRRHVPTSVFASCVESHPLHRRMGHLQLARSSGSGASTAPRPAVTTPQPAATASWASLASLGDSSTAARPLSPLSRSSAARQRRNTSNGSVNVGDRRRGPHEGGDDDDDGFGARIAELLQKADALQRRSDELLREAAPKAPAPETGTRDALQR